VETYRQEMLREETERNFEKIVKFNEPAIKQEEIWFEIQ